MYFAESSTKHLLKLYAGLLAAAGLTLTGCGSGGSMAPPPPIVVTILPASANLQAGTGTQNFTATLTNDSQSKGVTWSLAGAGCSGSTCGTLSQVTATSVTYSAPAIAPSPNTVTLTATSVADKTSSATATATITAAAAPTATLSASPTTIASGASSTLTWSSTNATSCTASGGWAGTEATSGTKSVSPTGTTTYTLTCTGAGGTSAPASATVTVAPTPTVTLTASPTTIASGASSMLTWSSTNATSCTASGGWTGTETTSGTKSVSPTSTTTYTLTCTGVGGTSTPAGATVTVAPTPTATLTANPTTIASGVSSTLTWSSTNATSCAASDGWTGTETTSGTKSVSPTSTTTYTLTCTGVGGTSAPASATVTVTAAAAPTAALSVSPKSITLGSSATLTWSSTNATSCTLNGSALSATSGSESVTPVATGSDAYNLSCTGTGGPATASATLTVVSAVPANVTITVNPSQTQPISPWIYGIDGNSNASIPNVPDVTIFRMGGNRWTAYNWTTNASNAGSDYLYESDNFLTSSKVPGFAVYPSINANIAAGQATLFTVPMQGLVSADESGPVPTTNAPDLARFQTIFDQKSTVSSAPFTTTPPVIVVGGEETGNVYSDEFVWAMNQLSTTKEIFSGTTSTPAFVDLDNEPDLWNSTHLEVQGPTEITPAAYIAKTLTMTEALKGQFPNLIIFGPSHYGFLGVYSFQGGVSGATPIGENWFADEYFQALSTASATFGKPLVDAYDFHWYPEDYDAGGTRVTSMTGATLSDADMQLIVQAPRNLWDPTFTDPGNSNAWPNSVLGGAPLEFLPRLQAKINAEFPSIKLSISEYETGGFNNIAGTVAQADELGVFASQGLFAGMLWPPSGTYDYELAGFRAYRNFDGAGSNFGDELLQTTSSNPGAVTAYVSTDTTTLGRIVMVAVNRANTTQVTTINGLTLSGTANLYQITAATAQGQSPVTPASIGTMAVSGSSLTLTLPAYSVTTIDIP